MDQIKTGKLIAALRKEHNLTQSQLGERLGVTNKTVSRWETGTYLPDIETLQLLSQTLHVTIEELLAGEVSPKPAGPTSGESAPKESPFSRREHEVYWKRKWKQDHLFTLVLCALGTAAFFWFLPKLFPALRILRPLIFPAALVEFAFFRNSMMAYVEKNIYDREILFREDSPAS